MQQTPHTKQFCWSPKKKKHKEEKTPTQPNETDFQNHPNRPNLPNNYRSNSNDRANAQKGHGDSPYVANRICSRSKN